MADILRMFCVSLNEKVCASIQISLKFVFEGPTKKSNIGSGNGLLSDGTKPLPEPM